MSCSSQGCKKESKHRVKQRRPSVTAMRRAINVFQLVSTTEPRSADCPVQRSIPLTLSCLLLPLGCHACFAVCSDFGFPRNNVDDNVKTYQDS